MPASASSTPTTVKTAMRSPRNSTPSGSANTGAVEDRTDPTATPAYSETRHEQDRAGGP